MSTIPKEVIDKCFAIYLLAHQKVEALAEPYGLTGTALSQYLLEVLDGGEIA